MTNVPNHIKSENDIQGGNSPKYMEADGKFEVFSAKEPSKNRALFLKSPSNLGSPAYRLLPLVPHDQWVGASVKLAMT